MTVGTNSQPDQTSDTAAQYKGKIDENWLVSQFISGGAAPHEAATPNMTVVLDAINMFDAITGTFSAVAQQTTSTITAPSTNPRIDRIAIDMADNAYVIIQGTEAASPSAPDYSPNHIPICQIALATSTTEITNSLITDERALTLTKSYGVTRRDETGTSYTLVIGDQFLDEITMNNASANTLTIPANASVAFPVGTQFLITQLGAGQTTVAITTDTLNVNSTFTKKLAGQYSQAVITKMTSTMWIISGDLEAV